MMPALQGRRILITRARDGAAKAADLFRAAGAVPILAPTIETVPLTAAAPLLDAMQDLQTDDWVVLTSPTAARIWAGLVPAAAVPARLAVVGEATADILRQAGYGIQLISPRATGLDLAEAIAAAGGGHRVVLPRSDKALPGLPDRLRQAGYGTIDLELYQTVGRIWSEAEALAAAAAEAVTLMSPSAAASLQAQPGIERWLPGCAVVALGPTTAQAVQRRFGRVDAVADPPSLEALVAATAEALARS